MKSVLAAWLSQLSLLTACSTTVTGQAAEAAAPYAIVVSTPTAAEAYWQVVVDALAAKRHAQAVTFSDSVRETLPTLLKLFPRCVGFIARPEEATREFATDVQRLTRRSDDDPYVDWFWGILTGYDAAIGVVASSTPTVRCSAGTCREQVPGPLAEPRGLPPRRQPPHGGPRPSRLHGNGVDEQRRRLSDARLEYEKSPLELSVPSSRIHVSERLICRHIDLPMVWLRLGYDCSVRTSLTRASRSDTEGQEDLHVRVRRSTTRRESDSGRSRRDLSARLPAT